MSARQDSFTHPVIGLYQKNLRAYLIIEIRSVLKTSLTHLQHLRRGCRTNLNVGRYVGTYGRCTQVRSYTCTHDASTSCCIPKQDPSYIAGSLMPGHNQYLTNWLLKLRLWCPHPRGLHGTSEIEFCCHHYGNVIFPVLETHWFSCRIYCNLQYLFGIGVKI